MILKLGPFSFAISHMHMPWRMVGAKFTFAIQNGTFQHEASIMIFGTGFAWSVDREPSSPLQIGISLVLASIPATIGLQIGDYKAIDATRQERMSRVLGEILGSSGIKPCEIDKDGNCATHPGGVLVNPTDTPKGY